MSWSKFEFDCEGHPKIPVFFKTNGKRSVITYLRPKTSIFRWAMEDFFTIIIFSFSVYLSGCLESYIQCAN